MSKIQDYIRKVIIETIHEGDVTFNDEPINQLINTVLIVIANCLAS